MPWGLTNAQETYSVLAFVGTPGKIGKMALFFVRGKRQHDSESGQPGPR
jgi:hypothetical protein